MIVFYRKARKYWILFNDIVFLVGFWFIITTDGWSASTSFRMFPWGFLQLLIERSINLAMSYDLMPYAWTVVMQNSGNMPSRFSCIYKVYACKLQEKFWRLRSWQLRWMLLEWELLIGLTVAVVKIIRKTYIFSAMCKIKNDYKYNLHIGYKGVTDNIRDYASTTQYIFSRDSEAYTFWKDFNDI